MWCGILEAEHAYLLHPISLYKSHVSGWGLLGMETQLGDTTLSHGGLEKNEQEAELGMGIFVSWGSL